MTSYSYTVALDDSEMIALKAAIKLYIKNCEENMPGGKAKSPYWGHRYALEQLSQKLESVTPKLRSRYVSPRDGQAERIEIYLPDPDGTEG